MTAPLVELRLPSSTCLLHGNVSDSQLLHEMTNCAEFAKCNKISASSVIKSVIEDLQPSPPGSPVAACVCV